MSGNNKRKKRKKSTPQKTSVSPRKTLTSKQRKFLSGKLEGQSSAQAARNAGYSESVALKADAIIGSSPAVEDAFRDLLQKAGVSDELLASRIREGLDATIVSKETQFANREELVDFGERREMAELVLRLTGLLKNKVDVQNSGDITIKVEYGDSGTSE